MKKNPHEIKDDLDTISVAAKEMLTGMLPEGFGFGVVIFKFKEDKMAFASNCDQAGIANLLLLVVDELLGDKANVRV